MSHFSLDQAMKAQAALRAAAGEGEEYFDTPQLVGMLSDEIRTLRASGSTDEDIARLLKADAGLDIDAAAIGTYTVETGEYLARD